MAQKITPGSFKNKVVASDLQEERDKVDFDAQELRVLMNGGDMLYNVRKNWHDLVAKHPAIQNSFAFYEMTPHQQQTECWKRINYIQTNLPEIFHKSALNKYPYFFWMNYMQGLLPGIGLHYTMFQAVTMTMCNDEQRKYWEPLIQNHKILGCYAQTELGHGSNVASLETTATFDKATDEIVINSPTITSTKYWPGDLGRFTTHGVVFARLIVDGQDYGVNAFMVQYRDVNTFQRFKGFNSGDLGNKFGYVSKDNGWATFDNLRIPRTNMLMRIAELSREGEFSIKGDPKVLYTTMMLIRQGIVVDCPQSSLVALKVAMRYGTCRRQFATIKGQRIERKIIDYQTFQSTLTPLMSQHLMQILVSNYIREQYKIMMDGVAKGNYDFLPVLHHLLAGMKALFSDSMMVTFDKARRCCGGAGYQSNSGMTELFHAVNPIQTYEGDNIVMLLQSARFVFKLVKAAQKGKPLPYPFEYIGQMKELFSIKGKGKSVEEMLDIQTIEQALAIRALVQIEATATAIGTSDAHEKVKDNELFSRMKLDMIKAHMEYICLYIYRTQAEKIQVKDPKVKAILMDVFRMAGLRSLIEDTGDVFATGFLAPEALKMMKLAQDRLVAKMRPQLIPIIESVVMGELPSNIGNYYGDVYELQLEQAKNAPLNKMDVDGVPPQWDQYIKPLLHGLDQSGASVEVHPLNAKAKL